jgi:hypothetical protein
MEVDVSPLGQRCQAFMVVQIRSVPPGGVPDDAVQRPGIQIVPTQSPCGDTADRALSRPGWAVDGEYGGIGVDGGLLLKKDDHSSEPTPELC